MVLFSYAAKIEPSFHMSASSLKISILSILSGSVLASREQDLQTCRWCNGICERPFYMHTCLQRHTLLRPCPLHHNSRLHWRKPAIVLPHAYIPACAAVCTVVCISNVWVCPVLGLQIQSCRNSLHLCTFLSHIFPRPRT
jgi:hypothetical protein